MNKKDIKTALEEATDLFQDFTDVVSQFLHPDTRDCQTLIDPETKKLTKSYDTDGEVIEDAEAHFHDLKTFIGQVISAMKKEALKS